MKDRRRDTSHSGLYIVTLRNSHPISVNAHDTRLSKTSIKVTKANCKFGKAKNLKKRGKNYAKTFGEENVVFTPIANVPGSDLQVAEKLVLAKLKPFRIRGRNNRRTEWLEGITPPEVYEIALRALEGSRIKHRPLDSIYGRKEWTGGVATATTGGPSPLTGYRRPDQVVDKIIAINKGLATFWKNCGGWAPEESAELLKAARLDRQVSLSHSLRRWIVPGEPEASEGDLILAYTNLGSLLEQSLRLFLVVYRHDYRRDPKAKLRNKGDPPEIIDLEDLRFEIMKQFFAERIWPKEWDEWVSKVQRRRNAIHSFKDREIGCWSEFPGDLRKYLEILIYIAKHLPYPEEQYNPFVESLLEDQVVD